MVDPVVGIDLDSFRPVLDTLLAGDLEVYIGPQRAGGTLVGVRRDLEGSLQLRDGLRVLPDAL